MRTGLIAKKIGMSNYYTPNGINIPVTVLHIEDCKVVERISDENSNLDKLVIGANEIKKISKLSKSVKIYFEKKNLNPLKITKEFKIDKSVELKAGDEINADHFEEGQFIDVSGFTKGKGFAGVMKRHNFGGLRASHGVSVSHRSHGSTGQCQDPGRVFKGKKMAGHMGDDHKTLQNLQVVKIDVKKNILCVKGATPGARGAWLVLEDSIKNKPSKDVDIKLEVDTKKKK
ncbi:MAG: 50S ribosomal protein L3 [Pelagibacterales bacterium]|nr:50S ribosomal protein L3 [Pelagibacterales bacterium]MBL6861822.1 50S ribosomal protein L3 [Pelagibacterales bacterium]